MRLKVVAIAALLPALAACQHPGQRTYDYTEIGKASLVNFGTVVAVREVDVNGQNTGAGAMVGAAAGGVAGSQFGRAGGNAAATLAGVAVGAIAGALIEQAAANRMAVEYTVTMESGITMTIVQDHNQGEQTIQPGDRVMVQVTGGIQRVLPANQLPTQIKRPSGIKVVD